MGHGEIEIMDLDRPGARAESSFFWLTLLLTVAVCGLLSSGFDAAGAEAGANAAVAQPAAATTPGPATGLLSVINVRATTAQCHKVDEVSAALFPRQSVIGYDFSGGDAGKLGQAMDAAVAAMATSNTSGVSAHAGTAGATLVRLVLLYATQEAIAFQFGSDGCHFMTLDLDLDDMGALFDRAGVRAPFGSTYYQSTGRAI
jgi:hypothetical protein